MAAHYARLQDEVLADQRARAIVPPGRQAAFRSAIRSAALRLSVSSMARESLQRAAMWFGIPAALLLAAAVPFIVTAPAFHGITYAAIAAALGAAIGAGTLLVSAAWRQGTLHFVSMVALAVLGVAIDFPHVGITQTAARAFTAFCVTPAIMYAAFLPMIVVASGFAWRLGRIIDPRARLVISLLRCVHQAARDTRWLRDGQERDRMAIHIERAARIAEHDLPRMLTRRTNDPGTREWLRQSAGLTAARIRECKRLVLLPDTHAGETLSVELLRLLLYATADEWDSMHAQQPPSKTTGPLRRYAPHATAAIVLIVAGLVLPEILPALRGVAGANFRTVLVLSGLVGLVPLGEGGLNRIPDAFADAVKPK